MPTCTYGRENFTDGKITVIDMLVAGKLALVKARRAGLLTAGTAFRYVTEKVTSIDTAPLSAEDFASRDIIVRKARKFLCAIQYHDMAYGSKPLAVMIYRSFRLILGKITIFIFIRLVA